jgi:hypothetical protein
MQGYKSNGHPNMTESEIKIAAHRFAESVRVLKQMDQEQKAKLYENS